MSSRSPSPPSPPPGNVDEPRRMDRLFPRHCNISSRRRSSHIRRRPDSAVDSVPTTPSTPSTVTSRGRRSRPSRCPDPSVPTASTPVNMFQFSTSGPSYASVVRHGLTDFEVDSSHLTIPAEDDEDLIIHLTIPDKHDEPLSPTSPRGGSPPSCDIGRVRFASDIEDYLDDPEDSYFKSLVDNFVVAAKDINNSMSPVEVVNYRQSDKYAVSALKYYNNNENNKVKYELVDAITSCGIIDMKGCYGHVNFTAKTAQKNSKEELFFAEVRLEHNTYVPTCILSLEGEKTVGGLCGSKYDNLGHGSRIDAQHCYACWSGLKHPKNGALFETGHVADSDYYHG